MRRAVDRNLVKLDGVKRLAFARGPATGTETATIWHHSSG